MTALVEKREARQRQARQRGEDLNVAVDLIVRSVPAVDDLITALDRAGGMTRLVSALRAGLVARRGRGR